MASNRKPRAKHTAAPAKSPPLRHTGRRSAGTRPGAKAKTKKINLALQGGGSHGAFTWGVLDGLLDDGRLEFEAISGTSAGAMNAVVLADGYERGGADEARANLERFWQGVSEDGAAFSAVDQFFDRLLGVWRLPGFDVYGFMEQISTLFSPYRLNPLNINPLRRQLDRLVDFEHVRQCRSMRLFIAATNVRTGKIKVFTDGEITADAVLASTTLPYLFQAVEVDGEFYWDGGYSGNPPLWPFFDYPTAQDILLVQVNPMERNGIPVTSQEIMERVSEVTFNAALLKELRAIDFVNRLMEEHRLDTKRYRQNRLHRIEASAVLADYNAASKLDTDWDFFQKLRQGGHEAARRWLDKHFDDVGEKATLDLRAEFL